MTEYKILSAGTERPMEAGRYTGEAFACIRLQVGKRPKLELIRLSDREALLVATALIGSVRARLNEEPA